MSICNALLRDLSVLIDGECWGVVCDEGSGSILGLRVGVRGLKRKPTNNDHLSELVRLYDPAYSFLVWCPSGSTLTRKSLQGAICRTPMTVQWLIAANRFVKNELWR